MNYLEAIKQIDGKFILAHYNKVYQTLFYYPVHGDEIYQNFTMRISDLLDNDWILVLKENAFYVNYWDLDSSPHLIQRDSQAGSFDEILKRYHELKDNDSSKGYSISNHGDRKYYPDYSDPKNHDYTEVWRVQNLRAIMRQEVNKALPQFYNEIDVEIDEDGNFYYTVYTNERQIKRSDVPPSFNGTPMKPRYLNTDLSGPLFVTGS